MTIDVPVKPDMVAAARRTARKAIRAVRCENRVVSRYLFNARAVRQYRRNAVRLSGEARLAVEKLRSSGVVLSSVNGLLGDNELFGRMADHVQNVRADSAGSPDADKPFLIELLGANPAIAPGDPLVEFALRPEIRGVAEAYSQMKLRVQDINVWINLPTGGDPTQSQRWHRDLPEDFDIVKCFVYLSDVPLGAGPLQYVRGTNTTAGRKLKFETEFDGIGYRVADGVVNDSFATEQIVTATGQAGAVVFADTRGLHRGGFAIENERVVLQITYASNASCRPRNLLPAEGVRRESLPDFRLAAS
jgi:hypothetical protein